jgi:hypothetical protein
MVQTILVLLAGSFMKFSPEIPQLPFHKGGLEEVVTYYPRIFHESLAATTDMAVLPGVLACWPLRRTVKVRLGTNTLRLPGGTPIFVVSRQ